jgi:hypothetical protein
MCTEVEGDACCVKFYKLQNYDELELIKVAPDGLWGSPKLKGTIDARFSVDCERFSLRCGVVRRVVARRK